MGVFNRQSVLKVQEQTKRARKERKEYQDELERQSQLDLSFATVLLAWSTAKCESLQFIFLSQVSAGVRDFEASQVDKDITQKEGYLYLNLKAVFVTIIDGILTG